MHLTSLPRLTAVFFRRTMLITNRQGPFGSPQSRQPSAGGFGFAVASGGIQAMIQPVGKFFGDLSVSEDNPELTERLMELEADLEALRDVVVQIAKDAHASQQLAREAERIADEMRNLGDT
jgi:hypothetical protein